VIVASVVTVVGDDGVMSMWPACTTVIVTVNVTEWSWIWGTDDASVAFPVTVTVNVAVEVAVPLNLTFTPVKNLEGVVPPTHGAAPPKHGDVLLNCICSVPLPEFRTVVAVIWTVPVNPAAVTADDEPEGRLPRAIVALAFAPVAKLAGLPLRIVMLKSCGLTSSVTG
jgi:hypothetical protein